MNQETVTRERRVPPNSRVVRRLDFGGDNFEADLENFINLTTEVVQIYSEKYNFDFTNEIAYLGRYLWSRPDKRAGWVSMEIRDHMVGNEIAPAHPRTDTAADMSPTQPRTDAAADMSPTQPRTDAAADMCPTQPRTDAAADMSPTQPRTDAAADICPTQPRTDAAADMSLTQPRTDAAAAERTPTRSTAVTAVAACGRVLGKRQMPRDDKTSKKRKMPTDDKKNRKSHVKKRLIME